MALQNGHHSPDLCLDVADSEKQKALSLTPLDLASIAIIPNVFGSLSEYALQLSDGRPTPRHRRIYMVSVRHKAFFQQLLCQPLPRVKRLRFFCKKVKALRIRDTLSKLLLHSSYTVEAACLPALQQPWWMTRLGPPSWPLFFAIGGTLPGCWNNLVVAKRWPYSAIYIISNM